MKFIANTFFLAMIWRRYRRLFIAIGLLLVSYFLVSLLHQDYLAYARNSGNATFLGLSYVVKWVILLVITLVFYFLIVARKTPKVEAPTKEQKTPGSPAAQPDKPDPFEAIRHKKKLRGHADQYLEDGKR